MAKYSSSAVIVPSAFRPIVSVISNAWRDVERKDSSPETRNFTGRRTLCEATTPARSSGVTCRDPKFPPTYGTRDRICSFGSPNRLWPRSTISNGLLFGAQTSSTSVEKSTRKDEAGSMGC